MVHWPHSVLVFTISDIGVFIQSEATFNDNKFIFHKLIVKDYYY